MVRLLGLSLILIALAAAPANGWMVPSVECCCSAEVKPGVEVAKISAEDRTDCCQTEHSGSKDDQGQNEDCPTKGTCGNAVICGCMAKVFVSTADPVITFTDLAVREFTLADPDWSLAPAHLNQLKRPPRG